MSFQPGAVVYTQGFGSRPENVEVPHLDVRDPATTDNIYPIGKEWINTVANSVWQLTSQSTSNAVLSSNWVNLAATFGNVDTITTQDSTVVVPTAGNINLSGSGSLATTGSGSTATVALTGLTNHALLAGAGTSTVTKLPLGVNGTILAGVTGADPAFTATPSGLTSLAAGTLAATTTVTAGTTITATLGAITATNGNFVKGTAGNKDVYTSVATTTTAGANSAGTVTLVGGTATVATTAVTAGSKIRWSRQGIGATGAAALGIVTIGTITAGVSFVINAVQSADATALQASDVSSIWWEIVN